MKAARLCWPNASTPRTIPWRRQAACRASRAAANWALLIDNSATPLDFAPFMSMPAMTRRKEAANLIEVPSTRN
jgi:hypothetical protein